MNNLAPLKPPGNAPRSLPTNPLARALAETEQSLVHSPQPNNDSSSLFSEALARAGGQFNPDNFASATDTATNAAQDPWAFQEQQRQWQAEQEKKKRHLELHHRINPTSEESIFKQNDVKVRKEIEQIKAELKLLVRDVEGFHKEVSITLQTQTISPGAEGKYYLSFFQKLRSFIVLLRQKIKSAHTWATQLNGKHSKKKKMKGAAGIMVSGADYEKTTSIQDMMHHERSSQYGAG